MSKDYISQVAKSLPFDNTTTIASTMTSTDTQSAIEEIYSRVKGNVSGVTPPFFFGRVSGGGAGTYLQINGVASNKLGQIVIGSNNLEKLSVTTSANVTGVAAVIQLQQRTGLNTFSDITGAQITIPISSYSAIVTFSTPIALASNVELAAYIKTGTTSDINLQVYVVSQ